MIIIKKDYEKTLVCRLLTETLFSPLVGPCWGCLGDGSELSASVFKLQWTPRHCRIFRSVRLSSRDRSSRNRNLGLSLLRCASWVTRAITDPKPPFPCLVGGRLCRQEILRQGGYEAAGFVSEKFKGRLSRRGLLEQHAGWAHLSPAALEAGGGGPGAGRSGRAPSPCRRHLLTVSTSGQSKLWALFPCKGASPIVRTLPPDLPKAPPPNTVPLAVWASKDGFWGREGVGRP